MSEGLLKLKTDIITNPPRFVVKREAILKGDFVQIQNYLIEGARRFAKDRGAIKRDAKRSWCFFEFLERYDTDPCSSKKMLESMIANTNGGNSYTPSEFLNYLSFSIASELSKQWATLGESSTIVSPKNFDPVAAVEAAKRELERRKLESKK
ncbi:hypothetical protein [Photobacterium lutimaris]|uniref:Uncharacterized protein n=1 Tax=Photobacterium lutimaris TaxID=388278 RepID=A0A2T3ITT8_9GAMM|nr:hypothetical protein [Photobacterium lutimaris]PSU31763.1 hypothetical protein C9I99_21505 [Photobacterium lutimaris]TDR72586.1 hypothetical protein DFP78_11362 [Photobacterium lutimaris]